MNLLDSLMKCAVTWTKLVSISPLPDRGSIYQVLYRPLFPFRTPPVVINAMRSLKPYVLARHLRRSPSRFLSIAENPALEAIEIRVKPPAGMMPSILHEKRLALLLRWEEVPVPAGLLRTVF
jgi:hypothetical protein